MVDLAVTVVPAGNPVGVVAMRARMAQDCLALIVARAAKAVKAPLASAVAMVALVVASSSPPCFVEMAAMAAREVMVSVLSNREAMAEQVA